MAVIYTFGDYQADTGLYQLRLAGKPQAVEPQVFDVLVYLIENRDRVVSKDDLFDAVWDGRIVSETTLTSRINAARTAIGDSGGKQGLIQTVPRRGYRFIAPVETGTGGQAVARSAKAPRGEISAHQRIQFCTAADGARLAWSSVGSGPALVKAAAWMSHLEQEWESPLWRHWLTVLSKNNRLIRYDQRGNGLSDRDVRDISFSAFIGDLETVADAAGADRFALLGVSQGCAISIAYAVRHPDRVSHLILYGGYAKGWRKRGGGPSEIAAGEALMTLIRQGWGQENPAFRQLFTSMFLPDGTAEQMSWFNELERISASPEEAARLFGVFGDIDVMDLLAKVKVPTLVLHCREDARAPFDEGRAFAAGIPNARFVPLEGRNHLMLPDEPAWHRFVEEVTDFLDA